jgi:2-oxoglutarate ferredoxin oxidoreductase subunit alpha
MFKVDLTIKIAGEAGQGLQAVGSLLSRLFARKGYYVFANQVVQSRVRGGHNWFAVRIADHPVHSPSLKTDILVALDQESSCHVKELGKDSIVIDDSRQATFPVGTGRMLDVPMAELASKSGAISSWLTPSPRLSF